MTTTSQVETLSTILFQRRKIHLFDYKDRWFQRRLSSRLRFTRCSDLSEYLGYIDRHPEELDRLLDALAINISSFFRNPEVFDTIRAVVFHDWSEKIRALHKRRFLAWSCACAQGEEPYSLAMMWQEFTAGLKSDVHPTLRIIASDIDREALASATAGRYLSEALNAVPPEWKERYFESQKGDRYEVRPTLRKMIEFKEENLLLPDRKRKFDLILCRNFLIFLDRKQQEQMFEIFSDCLHPKGYLVLGRVESMWSPHRTGFRSIHSTNRIYQKI